MLKMQDNNLLLLNFYPSVDAVMIATFPSSGLVMFENIFFICIPNEVKIGPLNL